MKTREEILKTEWSDRFEKLRKDAMETSYYKYGPARINYGVNKSLDVVENIKKRLQKYEETGNTEMLVDIANFAMLEFMYPSKESAHYKATDSGFVETVGFGINEIKE